MRMCANHGCGSMKKVALGAALGLAGLVVLALGVEKTTGLVSVGWDRFKAAVNGTITPEMQLELARKQIDKFDNDIAAAKDKLAKLLKSAEKDRAEIVTLEQKHAAREARVRQLRDDVVNVSLTDKKPANEKTLVAEWKVYKAEAQELAARKDALEANAKANEQALASIREMENGQNLLRAEVDRLSAELRTAKLKKNGEKFTFDGDRLAEINKSLEGVRDQVDEMKIRQSLDAPVAKPADTKDPAVEEALKDIDKELAAKKE